MGVSVPLASRRRYAVLCLAAGVSLLWLTLGPRTPDLAAQVYRADLFRAHGFVVYDPNWYAGHDVPGYSLLVPPLGALLGTRVLGVLAAITSALCFERLAYDALGRDAFWPARWFATATVCDLIIGRIAYVCGVALGLGALLAWQRRRSLAAAALAVLCALASPVAALFLALAAAAAALGGRRRGALLIAAVPLLAAGLLETVFPEGGRQPFALSVFAALLVLSLAGAMLLPACLRVVRLALVLYALAVVASFVVVSPMGSNVERLGAGLFAAMFLAGVARSDGRRRAALLGLVVAAIAFELTAPLSELAKVDDNPEVSGAYYAPLLAFLRAYGPLRGRLEVPFTSAHWEAEALAPHVALARGWERQLDTRYDALFYDPRGVGAAAYRRWLLREAVQLVAVADGPLDPAGRAEARLIDSHPAYLRPIWRSAHWRVYAVRGAAPLAGSGASVLALVPNAVTVRASRPGAVRLALHWTSFWRPSSGCATQAPGQFTELHVPRAETLRLTATLSVAGALGTERACSRARP